MPESGRVGVGRAFDKIELVMDKERLAAGLVRHFCMRPVDIARITGIVPDEVDKMNGGLGGIH